MAKGIKVCKVCGCEYEYCRTNRPSGLFRWQDVACCVEHGTQYFDLVAKARAAETQEDHATELSVDKPADEEQPKKKRSSKATSSIDN